MSAYYAALWGGNQSSNYNSAIMPMSESNTTYLEALNDMTSMELNDFKDDFIETQWAEAKKNGDKDDMAYYESRMSEPLQKLYTAPDDSMDIVMEAYETTYNETITDLESRMDTSAVMYDKAKEFVITGDKANTNGDQFTFATVLFTIVLFFGGMAAVSSKEKIKMIYGIAMIVTFIYSVYTMFSIPMP